MIVEVRISNRGAASIYRVDNGEPTKLMGVPITRVLLARMNGRRVRRFKAEEDSMKTLDPNITVKPHALDLGDAVD